MSDQETLKLVIPAISLGFAVVNDEDGKLRFYCDGLEIVYRDGWISRTVTDDDRPYHSLIEALQNESWRIE